MAMFGTWGWKEKIMRRKIREKIDLRGKSGRSQKGGIWEGRDTGRKKTRQSIPNHNQLSEVKAQVTTELKMGP